MIKHETLIEILDSVYKETDVKYEIQPSYNDNKRFTIAILYPKLNVSNEDGDEIDLNNFVVKITGEMTYNNNGIWYRKFNSLEGYNLCPTEEMVVAGYAHSHVSGLTSPTVCLGATALHDVYQESCRYLTEEKLYDFFTLLDVMLHHESIDGGPYVYIENVHNAEPEYDLYKYISTDDYQSFREDYCISDQVSPETLSDSPYLFLYQIKSDYTNNLLDENGQETAIHIHNLIKRFADNISMPLDPAFSYVSYYLFDEDIADTIVNSSTYKELLGLFEFVHKRHMHENKPMQDIIADVFEFYKAYGNVNIEDIQSVSKTTYARILLNDEVYDEDDLYHVDDVIHYLEDYASIEGEHDYNHRVDHVNSLSFFINGNIYRGEAEPIEITENAHFNAHEYIEETYKIEGRYSIQRGIRSIANEKESYHNIVIRNSTDYLVSASNRARPISLL